MILNLYRSYNLSELIIKEINNFLNHKIIVKKFIDI